MPAMYLTRAPVLGGVGGYLQLVDFRGVYVCGARRLYLILYEKDRCSEDIPLLLYVAFLWQCMRMLRLYLLLMAIFSLLSCHCAILSPYVYFPCFRVVACGLAVGCSSLKADRVSGSTMTCGDPACRVCLNFSVCFHMGHRSSQGRSVCRKA